jgi:hypothetical protein
MNGLEEHYGGVMTKTRLISVLFSNWKVLPDTSQTPIVTPIETCPETVSASGA